MLDKIVLSQDKRYAMVITSEKSFTLYHSEGKVLDLVNEFVFESIKKRTRMEEITEKIEIQLNLYKEVA